MNILPAHRAPLIGLPRFAPLPVAVAVAAALAVAAVALFVAAVNPTLDGLVVAAVAGTAIVAIGLCAAATLALLHAMPLPRTNDDFIHW